VLAFAVIAAAVWSNAHPSVAQDLFDKTNESKFDPFSEANKAPPVDLSSLRQSAPAPKPLQKIKGVEDMIDFYVTVTPQQVRRGQTVRVNVTGVPRVGCYTYSMTIKGEDQRPPALGVFRVKETAGFKPLGPIEETPPPILDKESGYFEHKQAFTWEFDVLVTADAQTGPAQLAFLVDLQVCKTSCVPGDIALTANFTVDSSEPVALTPELKSRANEKFPPPAKMIPVASSPEKGRPSGTTIAEPTSASAFMPRDYAESIERIRRQIEAPAAKPREGLLTFILTGMFWGFVSLITPCVFPMIPITVSFFLKQSEKEHHKPVIMALVYCGTIVVVLTIAAAALLSFFRLLSINPTMNFALGGLFVFFALSLFGMYDIELPSFLARFTSERESKGGMIGTIFMALTFTIISFACVAPFLGGFGGTADTTSRPFWHTIMGGLAFSVTFAAPFFLLALFPTMLRAMPKSGSWLNSVKVVMGFLELAAALKFFRAGELVLAAPLGLFTFDLVLGLWIALCVLCGLYLLGTYRLPHDSPVEHLSVPRMLFAFAFIGLGFYLTPALFVKSNDGEQPRPSGVVFAWVHSFLLPEMSPGAGGEVWSPNLENAIAQAREFRKRTGMSKLVFVDFTGETCTNCKKNENDVFRKPEIQKLFKPYVLVRLYTDTVPLMYYAPEDRAAAEGRRTSDARVNNEFERRVFETAALPLYVILDPLPDGKINVIAQYDEGLIRNEGEFAEFLRQPQQAIGTAVASR
jgi:thiol:disulfide interchange protein DsbD